MSLKLQSIELEAFRAYKDIGYFDFTLPTGEAANLVVIYAPNGFGKTSFFDAVEWAFTGKINKISENSRIKNIADYEKGHILKNIDSDLDKGRVKIITDNNNILEVYTKQLGRHNRQTDYHSGDVVETSKAFEETDLIKFASNNIMCQHKIDSFLTFSTAKQRYDTLSNFWDGKEDTSMYRQLLSLSKEAEKKDNEINQKLVQLEEEIGKLAGISNNLDVLNERIIIFNNKNNFEVILSKITDLLSFNVGDFVGEVTSAEAKVKSEQDKINSSLSNLLDLDNTYPNFVSNQKTLDIIDNKIKELSSLVEKHNKVKENEIKIKNIKFSLLKLESEYNDFKFLQENSDVYVSTQSKVSSLQKESYEDNKKLNSLEVEFKGLELNLSNNNTNMQKLESKISVYKGKVKSLDNVHQEFQKNFYTIERNLQKIKVLEDINKKRDLHKSKLTREVSYFDNIVNYSTALLIELEIPEIELNVELQGIKNIYNNINVTKKLLEQAQQEYMNLGELNEQVNTIVKVGREIIEETKTESCPLCKNKFKDYTELLMMLNSDLGNMMDLQNILGRITSLKNENEVLELELESKKETFKSSVSEKIKGLIKEIQVSDKKLNMNYTLIEKLRRNNRYLGTRNQQIELYFNEINLDVKQISGGALEAVKKGVLDNIKINEESILGYQKQNKEISSNIVNTRKRMDEYKLKLHLNKIKQEELLKNPKYVSIEETLANLDVKFTEELIEGNVKELRQEKERELQIKSRLIDENNSLLEQLKDKKYSDCLSVLEEYKDKRKPVYEQIEKWKSKYQIYVLHTESVINKEALELEIEKRQQSLKDIEILLGLLSEIGTYVETLESIIERSNKGKEKEKLEKEHGKIQEALEHINEFKSMSKKYIEKRINDAFNITSINNIYSRIDPHPNLSLINFEPDLTKENPELNIYASNGEEKKVAPVLYFSSAQVNILSLSIFLARALQEDEETGISTIFMDDPIQYLDNINILSFIDLIRTISTESNRQVIISTHNETFYNLLKRKLNPNFCSSKFIELGSHGTVK
ncbi:AAA family ATPase [Bacillus wiedmannii]|uniref:AAA family ATPase n=1 Tax=Bacillus wiedmannii TaxID=1890302 RepID=UPI000BF02C89|nr:AAA family ATPase [Bacillus wiedmannii]PEL43855.1 hypothetical protein CN607_05365 [Bacillus wiedmannii]